MRVLVVMLVFLLSGVRPAPASRPLQLRTIKNMAIGGAATVARTLLLTAGAVRAQGLDRTVCTCREAPSTATPKAVWPKVIPIRTAGNGCKACDVGQAAVAEQFDQIGKGYGFNPRNERIFDTRKNSFLPAHPENFLYKELGSRNVIVVGEVHSNRCHHHAEFEVVRAVSQNQDSRKLSIGLECFYRQHQKALDDFIFSHKDMGKLKSDVNWRDTWGYDLNYYAKIFNFAAINRIRLVGLNVPYPVVQFVGANGFTNLPQSVKTLLPTLDLTNALHKQQFIDAITGGDYNAKDHFVNSAALENMYQAQTLWDEYMAESAANYIAKNPTAILLVIAGVGHVLGRAGIPDRIEKRTKKVPFVILPQEVGWGKVSGLPDITLPLGAQDCDWGWYTE